MALSLLRSPGPPVTHLAVLRSFSACSGFARLSTLRNSATRWRMRLCMYALEHFTVVGATKVGRMGKLPSKNNSNVIGV